MTRHRPACPYCAKRLRNERAMNAHIRDAHFRAGNFGPYPGGAGRWVAAAIIIAAACAFALLATRAKGFESGDSYGPGGRPHQYDSSPELRAYVTTRRRALMYQITEGARRGEFQKFTDAQLTATEEGFQWVLANGQITPRERVQIKFILEEVERERLRRRG